jgi:nucleotide-binding universal stress UspA family protein
MPSSIIVGLALRDDDSAPLALARLLSDLSGCGLALVTACPRETPTPLPVPAYTHEIHAHVEAQLEAVARGLRGEHDVTIHVADGSPAGVMHRLADELGAAAVVVGSTHRGAVGRVLIGDVAAGLLHGAPCPVVVAPRDYDAAELRRIGVAYDGSPESEEALAAAVGLATRTRGSLRSYTVLEPIDWSGAYAVPGWVPSPQHDDALREHAQSVAERALESVPKGMLASSEVLHGRVVPTLAGVSHELDVLVCGSRGYGALRSVGAGGVSRGLAHEAACPLLFVPRQLSPTAAGLWLGGANVAGHV